MGIAIPFCFGCLTSILTPVANGCRVHGYRNNHTLDPSYLRTWRLEKEEDEAYAATTSDTPHTCAIATMHGHRIFFARFFKSTAARAITYRHDQLHGSLTPRSPPGWDQKVVRVLFFFFFFFFSRATDQQYGIRTKKSYSKTT